MSTISEKDLITFFQQLEDKPLEPNNPFYEPYLSTEESDPIVELARNIKWSPGESVTLLSGLRGNGKSTELRRLRSLLEAEDYTVFLCDMESFINPHTPIEITDFLVSVMSALSEVVRNQCGANFSKEGYWERFTHFLKTEIHLKGTDTSAGIGVSLLRDYSFKKQLQETLRSHAEQVIEHAQKFAQSIRNSLKENDQHQLVLLVDSVEKIRGRGSDAHEVYESVENLFKRYGDKLRLAGWHVVYTVPPYVTSLILGGGNICQLPSVHIFNRESEGRDEITIDENGIKIMEHIVNRRFERWEQIFSKSQMRQMILATGGDFRDFFRLIRGVLRKIPVKNREVKMPINDQLIVQAKSDLLNDMLPIPTEDQKWLRRIATTHKPELQKHDDLPRFISFFDNNLVLTYRNGERWYDIHPLLKEYLIKSENRRVEPL